MFQKDSVLIGILIGLVVPFMAYGILLTVYDQLDAVNITAPSLGGDYRARTIGLVAMAANIIPINIFKNRYLVNSMRGIMLATLIYVLLWIYLYLQLIL